MIEIHDGVKFKEHWMKYRNGYVCHSHYSNLVLYQKHKNGYYKEYSSQRISFLDKRFNLKRKIRKGVCQWCKRKNGDKFINSDGKMAIILTHLHHWFYLPIMVWACTEEICNHCHTTKSWKIKPLK